MNSGFKILRDRYFNALLVADDLPTFQDKVCFNYLGNDIGYDKGYYTDTKLGKFHTICGAINRIFRNMIGQEIKLQF